MVCLQRSFSEVLRAVFVGTPRDVSPVFDGADAGRVRGNSSHTDLQPQDREGTAVLPRVQKAGALANITSADPSPSLSQEHPGP